MHWKEIELFTDWGNWIQTLIPNSYPNNSLIKTLGWPQPTNVPTNEGLGIPMQQADNSHASSSSLTNFAKNATNEIPEVWEAKPISKENLGVPTQQVDGFMDQREELDMKILEALDLI